LLLIDAISKLGFHPHIKCFHYAGGGGAGGDLLLGFYLRYIAKLFAKYDLLLQQKL